MKMAEEMGFDPNDFKDGSFDMGMLDEDRAN
jgi:hypothetical protein